MDLVRDFGWNLSHFQKLERGVLDPKLSTLVRLAKDFGITLAELLTDFRRGTVRFSLLETTAQLTGNQPGRCLSIVAVV